MLWYRELLSFANLQGSKQSRVLHVRRDARKGNSRY